MKNQRTLSVLLACLMGAVSLSGWSQNPSGLPEIVEEGHEESSPAEVGGEDVFESTDEVALEDSAALEPRVEGLRYHNPEYGFALTLPNADWQFLIDREMVESYNEEALVVMNAPDLDLYSMVIVEELPDVSLGDYADMIQPSLEDLVLIADKEAVTAEGLPAWRMIWEGTYDDIGMRFHYTLLEKETYRIQIVSWCTRSIWDAGVEEQFEAIGESFESTGPAVTSEEAWSPPAVIDEADRYENQRHSFSLVRPSPDWVFVVSREELNAINPNATVVVHLNDEIYSMVIVERLPDLTLAEYSGRVVPNLEGASLVEEEETTVGGIEARKRRWRGKFEDIPFDFFYTLLDIEGKKFQIVSWCSTARASENIRAQIRYIEESFAPLGRGE